MKATAQEREAEAEARAHHLNASVFLLIHRSRNEHLGCATLFQRGDDHFLVSATHVLESILDGRTEVLMPQRPPRRDVAIDLVPIGPGELVRFQKKTRPIGDDDYREDVAAHRLKPEAAEVLKRDGWNFLKPADVFIGAFDRVVLYGWPLDRLRHERRGGQVDLVGEPVFLSVPAVPRPETLVDAPTAGELFMELPPGVPDIVGISGSPIWVEVPIPPGEIWSPSQQLKLVGIEHARGAGGDYARGTLWGVVAHMLTELSKGNVPDG